MIDKKSCENQVVDHLSSLENEEKIQARKNYELKTLEIVDEFHDGKIINGEIQAIICWYGELQCYKQYIIEELKKKMLRKKLLQQNMHEFVRISMIFFFIDSSIFS